MTTQPEALRLAAVPIFDRSITWQSQATIELRRLNEEVETNGTIIQYHEASIARLTSQRDALLEALIRCRNRFFPSDQPERDRDELWEPVNAAIKQAEGENT